MDDNSGVEPVSQSTFDEKMLGDLEPAIEAVVLPSTDTHDIYAQTSFWNGVDREPYNCSTDGIFPWTEADLQRIDATLPKTVIYYFGPKVSS